MDRKVERIDRDAAGIGPYAREREGLVPLSSLSKWDVSKGDVDVRGWDLRTISGRQLGVVRDLLVDKDAHEVVMLDVDVPGEDRHALVPVRTVQIDRAARVILMDSSDFETVASERNETREETRTEAVRDRDVADETPRTRSASTTPTNETVVDRKPVVEETVVRRYEADAARDVPDDAMVDPSERRRADRRRIDRLGTDL